MVFLGSNDFENSGAHGNAKSQDSIFQPTLPSTLNKLRDAVSHTSAHKVYKKNNHVARNLKQLQNLKHVYILKMFLKNIFKSNI